MLFSKRSTLFYFKYINSTSKKPMQDHSLVQATAFPINFNSLAVNPRIVGIKLGMDRTGKGKKFRENGRKSEEIEEYL